MSIGSLKNKMNQRPLYWEIKMTIFYWLLINILWIKP